MKEGLFGSQAVKVQNQSRLLDNVGARDTVVLYNSQDGDK